MYLGRCHTAAMVSGWWFWNRVCFDKAKFNCVTFPTCYGSGDSSITAERVPRFAYLPWERFSTFNSPFCQCRIFQNQSWPCQKRGAITAALPMQAPWCGWTFWPMLSKASTMPRSVASARCSSGRAPRWSSASWPWWWSTVSPSPAPPASLGVLLWEKKDIEVLEVIRVIVAKRYLCLCWSSCRLHWWIRDNWWSQSWEDCCQPHRQTQQGRICVLNSVL